MPTIPGDDEPRGGTRVSSMTGGNEGVASECRRLFELACGAPPAWVAQAPGRVNLIGEHVDYCGGPVLPMAIHRRAVVAARPSTDGLTRVRSSAFDGCIECEPEAWWAGLRSRRGGARHHRTFADRLLGVLLSFRHGPWADERGATSVPPLEILVHSDVPVGGGLSSSAATTAALALLASRIVTGCGAEKLAPAPRDDPSTARLLARMCQWSEHEVAGVPCGIMDMLVSLAGRAGSALLMDCSTLCWEAVPWPEEIELLLVDSGIRHDHASGAYAARRRECEQAAHALGACRLAEADERAVTETTLHEPLRRRALHVTSECRRVREFVAALRRADLDRLGAILFEGHDSLRELFEVSTPELDRLVEAARRHRATGILGARLTGGGFGGCVVVLTRAGCAERAADVLVADFESAFGRRPTWLKIQAGDGAAILECRPDAAPQGGEA